jgi:hypothetical protein
MSRFIVMTDDSVRLLKRNLKTQTRRVMKPQPTDHSPTAAPPVWQHGMTSLSLEEAESLSPVYGKAGEVVWVRETHSVEALTVYPCPRAWYRADFDFDEFDMCGGDPNNHIRGCAAAETGVADAACIACAMNGGRFRWRSPRYMAKRMSRITLRIESVRVQRLHDITDADANRGGLPAVGAPSRIRRHELRPMVVRCPSQDRAMHVLSEDGVRQRVEPHPWWPAMEHQARPVPVGREPLGLGTLVRDRVVMRALTLTQPWCGLVASGVKRIENRPRSIIRREDFGRPFALHASREINEEIYLDIGRISPRLMGGPDVPWRRLSRCTSAVIGVATVERAVTRAGHDPREKTIVDINGGSVVDLGDQECWFFGPIGYVLRDIRALPSPVPCRGWQGFWGLLPAVEAQVAEQIGAM